MIKRIFLFLVLLVGLSACVKETIDLNNLSRDLNYQRSLVAPLLNAHLIFEDVANAQADSASTRGGDTLKFFFPQIFDPLHDTMPKPSQGENMRFDHFLLSHTITNMFPIGLNMDLIFYDSASSENIDTVKFSKDPDEFLLKPAPIDARDSLVNEDLVETYTDVVGFTESQINNYYDATHFIIRIEVPPSQGIIRILDYYELRLNLGIDVAGRIVKKEEDEEN